MTHNKSLHWMLFDDKREVELIWNGKTSEVTSIVLPFQVSEQVDEPRKIQPLMDANTRESGKTIRVHSRFKIIRAIRGIAYLIIDSVLNNG